MHQKLIKIAAFSGSLRRESYSTKLVRAFMQLAPEGTDVEFIQKLDELPFFNEDQEANPPEQVQKLIQKCTDADAFLFITPEYNRSYTAVLKNALDWASRSDALPFYKKPAAVAGITPYNLGAFGAVHHLRQVFTYLNMYTLQQPEFHVTDAAAKFNEAGELTDENTIRHIENFWREYTEFLHKVNTQ